MMRLKLLPCFMLALGGIAWADEAAHRDLMGEWQSRDGSGPAWTLQNAGEELHVIQVDNNDKLSEFQCNTSAKECGVQDHGGVKVSMWYNGSKLVVQEIRGAKVLRYRFQATGDDKMDLEVVPIVPEGKTQTLRFVRKTQSSAVRQ